jgi:1,4-dihydroxy-2-naphthoate octaprenyltransferase
MGSAAVLFPLLLLVAALAPFSLGVLLACASGFPVKGPVLAAATLAAVALILAGLASREAYAPEIGPWPHWQKLDRKSWQRLAYVFLSLAGVLGFLLQWVWQTGDFTIPLGAVGILCGYFIFAPPLAWHRRGLGEFWGGLCFGLLPVLTGYYLQAGHLISEILLYGVPLSLAAFNLLLLLGFPRPGGQETARLTLAARLGPVGVGLLYTIINILVIVGLIICLFLPAASHWSQPWLWALIVLALINQELVKRRAYYQAARIQLLCFSTLALILGMNLIFALGLWGRL